MQSSLSETMRKTGILNNLFDLGFIQPIKAEWRIHTSETNSSRKFWFVTLIPFIQTERRKNSTKLQISQFWQNETYVEQPTKKSSIASRRDWILETWEGIKIFKNIKKAYIF